jgi:hypothetical protein
MDGPEAVLADPERYLDVPVRMADDGMRRALWHPITGEMGHIAMGRGQDDDTEPWR